MSLPWPHSLCPCHCVVFSDGNSSEPSATVLPLVNNISLIGIIWRQKAWFLQAWNSVLSQSESHGKNRLSPLPYLSSTTDVHHTGMRIRKYLYLFKRRIDPGSGIWVRFLLSYKKWGCVQVVDIIYCEGPSFWWWLDSVNAVGVPVGSDGSCFGKREVTIIIAFHSHPLTRSKVSVCVPRQTVNVFCE